MASASTFKDPVILPLQHDRRKPIARPSSPPEPALSSAPAEPLSKRKQFLATRYLPSTLQHIRSSGLGENRWPVDKPENHTFLYPRPGQQPLEFLAAAKKSTSFWPNEGKLPEIAVIGRSNVGKSRLLNVTFGTSVVRVKDKPGLTQSINWYRAAKPLAALVVDMPGYGFAFAKEQLKADWDQLLLDFLARDTLVRLFVLVDARHGIKVNDIEFLEKLKGMHHFRLTIVMTKCDLVRMEILARQHRLVCDKVQEMLGTPADEVLMVSSRTGAGIVNLRQSILQHVKSLAPRPASDS
ncbi:P-loop containing nucleoside triphosphate hydrolase protein [Catenaria anguillulae PL171]|uniref:p-loop containing nucleoside triphosphate hydrolase protein n=1 Tax=Catenaria anguillulae PL171 TaxID=765915 RepID=A0A1Y2HF45_9FUNG|nr:P-loop containing nucleoside triphosphate hydrolase protein [Catenaria anguillulae PL171]